MSLYFSNVVLHRGPSATKEEDHCIMRKSNNYWPVSSGENQMDMDKTKDNSIAMKSLNADDRALLYPKLGPYFDDGQRRVDYVLTYQIAKPISIRQKSPKMKENNFIRKIQRSLSMRGSRAHLQPKEDPEITSDEDDKQNKREEFEKNLLETGLELEKADECKIAGIGFLKIHAPWAVLCREAEFMKLKMPTNKVFEVKQASNIVEKIRMFIHKVTSPLHPKVKSNKQESVKSLCHPFSKEKEDLFDFSDQEHFFDSKTRSSIVYEVLKRTKCTQKDPMYSMGLSSLLAEVVYTSAYPPHDGDIEGVQALPNDRKTLYEEWASYCVFYKYQPIGLISMEICDPRNNITMCPLCDRACGYWKLVAACGTARASHLFDNPATVFFSIFMALWAVLFMEHWKRRQMRLNYVWDLTSFGEEEEEEHKDNNRAEYELLVMQKAMRRVNSDSKNEKMKLTCTDRLPFYLNAAAMMAFMITVTFVIVFGVVLYRISIKTALEINTSAGAGYNVRATVKTTAAIINLIVIIILDEIYGVIARWLTILEVPKTDKSFEERLIIKTFILKFVNAFTPIVYLAFFRGRLVGRPGNYFYVVGSYRMEECAHAGCLMELCIQLCITMLGKQLIQNNLFEIAIPKLKKMLHKKTSKMDKKQQEELIKTLQQHEKDHFLGPFVGLNPEYMEMIIQFGMVTLFVASFPLAPLFALLNNIIEIRLDAKKFVKEFRRPIAVRAKNIGIWYKLLRGLSKVAVIVNAFVISFTSDFIPRLVYQYMYSPDTTMHGFVNHSLSYFNVSDFQPGTGPTQPTIQGQKVELCRYKDYREPPSSSTPYDFSKEFWAILAARLAFVVVFQNVVMLMRDFVDWLIPDIPKDISLRIHKEKVLMVDLFMKQKHGMKLAPQEVHNRKSCTASSSNQSLQHC
ncbi:anoctamin-1a isoform X7 [Stigmatopora nigra]